LKELITPRPSVRFWSVPFERRSIANAQVKPLKLSEQKPMRRLIIVSSSFVALLGPVARSEEQAENPSFWMKKKLEHSERILEGLTAADFGLIAMNAKSMDALGQIEKFARRGMPGYRTQLRVFRFANEELIRQAEAKNVDGAAMAYMQLTLSCVNCHKIVRDPQRSSTAE
jgi:hypothetical protein